MNQKLNLGSDNSFGIHLLFIISLLFLIGAFFSFKSGIITKEVSMILLGGVGGLLMSMFCAFSWYISAFITRHNAFFNQKGLTLIVNNKRVEIPWKETKKIS